MNTLETIITRRSIRKFRSIAVTGEITEKLLRAAMYAPSARNTRAWQFIVINKREGLDYLSGLHPYGKMLKEATLAILVCGDKGIEKEEGYLVINCSAATQNILLASHELGLGSVWLGIYPREQRMHDLSAYLGLPEHVIPVSLIAIGIPAEIKEIPDRFEPVKIHYNGW